MNPASEPLQLRDIHLPSDISWWPPAPGWWLLLGLIVLISITGVVIYRYWQARKLYRAANLELLAIQTAYAQHADDQQLVQALSIWLRRVCLSCYPRATVAGLTGQDWLTFLDQQLSRSKHPQRFSDASGQVLINGPYQQSTQVDADVLLSLSRHWLKCLPRQRSQTI